METRSKYAVPFMAVHPGDVLRAELKERGIKQKDFAARIGMQATHLNELLHGKRNISPDVAAAIEDVLGIPAVDWLNLQSMYDFDRQYLATKSAEEAQARLELSDYNRIVSVPDLLKRSGSQAKTYVEKLAEVKSLAQKKSAAELSSKGVGMFRKSGKTAMDERMTRTWVLLARRRVSNLPAVKGKFDRASVGGLVVELRGIFNDNRNVIERVGDTFSIYGIKFAIEPKLDKANVDGLSFLDGDVPCIVVTKRFDKIDLFAFSVMHELGHVINDLNVGEEAILSWKDYETTIPMEKAADGFAREGLIPGKLWSKAPLVKPNASDMQGRLSAWASEIGYNKWLVLGRAAHELNMYRLKDDSTRRIG